MSVYPGVRVLVRAYVAPLDINTFLRGTKMKKLTGIGFGILLVCFACQWNPQVAIAAIRVVAYNTENNPDDANEDAWFNTIFSAIGNESINGLSKRLDVLIVSETDTGSSARLVQILNDLYGVDTYDVNTSSTSQAAGGDQTGVVYDTSTLTLLDSSDLTNIGLRPVLRAHFRLVGQTGPNSEFYVYAVHLKASDGVSDRAARAAEVINLRANADALGEGAHIIFGGDFNLYRSSEVAWTNMLAAGDAQAFDPLNRPGDWHDDPAFISLHSQRPDTAMDDRFDFQFVTGEFMDGNDLDYSPGSYHVFGNNGTHTLNGRIGTGSGASQTVLNALENASDHLPVVADYVSASAACVNRPSADINGDCIVNVQDMVMLLEQWMDCGLVPQSACPE
jgi:endonuclease/exonuclease/phosphatase family metal-dependent hydrolase